MKLWRNCNMQRKLKWKWVCAAIFILLLMGCSQREHEYFRIETSEKATIVVRNLYVGVHVGGTIVLGGTDTKGVDVELVLKPGYTYKLTYIDQNRMAEDAKP